MTNRETLATAHGKVEYETVECESCSELMVKEDATRVYVGDYHGKDSWSHQPYDEIKLSNYHWGYLCQYCREDPAGFPYDYKPINSFMNWVKSLAEPWQFLTIVSLIIGLCFALLTLMGIVGTLIPW